MKSSKESCQRSDLDDMGKIYEDIAFEGEQKVELLTCVEGFVRLMYHIRMYVYSTKFCSTYTTTTTCRHIRMLTVMFVQFLNRIGCHINCREIFHTAVLQPILDAVVKPGETPSVSISLKAPEPVMTRRSEFWVYSGDDMAGDVGGMMGMLLGLSVLAIYDSMLKWLAVAKKRLF